MSYSIIILGVVACLVFCLQSSCKADQIKYKHPYETEITENDNNNNNFLIAAREKKINGDAVTLYYRLVKHLFRKQRFKKDPHSDNYYIANIPLRLKQEQFEILVNSDVFGLNVNEIDSIIEDVFKQSKNEELEHSIIRILYDYYKEEILNSITSISTPILIIIGSSILMIFVSKMFHFSKLTYSAILFFLILIVCIMSYAISYHECMNDLEVEQMIQLSKQNSQNNPCKDYHGEQESYWSSFKTLIRGSAENECLNHMRKTFKPSKKFCDPLDVFAKWSAKIQMSYFGSVFGEFLGLVSEITASSNIFSKIIIWTASLIFFGFFIITFIKVIVKYSFAGVFSTLSRTTTSSNDTINPSIEQLNCKMDALLNENEHMKKELHFIRECSVERSLQGSSPVKKRKLESITELSSSENKDKDKDED